MLRRACQVLIPCLLVAGPSACAATRAPLAASVVTGARANAAAFDLQVAIDRAMAQAQSGQTAQAAGTLRALSDAITIDTSADLRSAVMITTAQRQLVQLSAARGKDDVMFIATQVQEVKRSYNAIAQALKQLAAAQKLARQSHTAMNFDFEDVMVMYNDALDAYLEQLPTPYLNRVPNKASTLGTSPTAAFGYCVSARGVLAQAGYLAKTDGQFAELQTATQAAMAKAPYSPSALGDDLMDVGRALAAIQHGTPTQAAK